jgi:predicted O-linked N-acetylglucosamine transferase (SPINDLY family)
LAALGSLRKALRARFFASPLCDGPRFAENLTAAFEAMWQARCAAN